MSWGCKQGLFSGKHEHDRIPGEAYIAWQHLSLEGGQAYLISRASGPQGILPHLWSEWVPKEPANMKGCFFQLKTRQAPSSTVTPQLR